MQDDQKIADELNDFLTKVVSNLRIDENSYIINHNSDIILHPVEKAICEYKFHLSILIMKCQEENQDFFSFYSGLRTI